LGAKRVRRHARSQSSNERPDADFRPEHSEGSDDVRREILFNPLNDAGNTPITVTVPSFRLTARPRTSGALLNIRFQ
jgi:hypothetical protein